MRRQIRLVFHTETGAGPAGQRRGHTPKPQQPQGTEKSTRHTNHKCSTSLATERSLGAVEGALVIIRNPSQLMMFLFLSEQHSDTGVTDSSRAATHLTTGLEGSRVHCKQTLGGPRGEDQRCDAMWREGGPSQCLPVPLLPDPAASEASQPPPLLPRVCQSRTSTLSRSLSWAHTGFPSSTHPFNNSNYCQTGQINFLSQDLTLKLLGNGVGFRTSTTNTARTLHSRQ